MLRKKNYVYGSNKSLVPAHLHFGTQMLEICKLYKDNIALIDAGTGAQITYGDVAQTAVDVALSLSRIGVGKGDVVCVCSEKRIEFIPTMIGVICAGASFTPADISCRNASILKRINMVKPKVVFCSPSVFQVHKETLKSVESLESVIVYGDDVVEEGIRFKDFMQEHAAVEDFVPTSVEGWKDVAVILYSSGTTGTPKGVPLTHLNFLLCFQHGLAGSNFTGTRMLSTREWYYTYGLKHTFGALQVGATVVFTRKNGVRDFLDVIQKFKISIIQLVPTTICELVKSALPEDDVSSLTCMMSTSTPLDAELVNAAKKKFSNLREVLQMYGMTETGCVCDDLNSTKGPKPGSVGCVNSGVIIKVVDLKTREALGPDSPGEICLKSASVMLGYVGDTSRDYWDEEGFFKTGDVGYYDVEKYFFIVDRIKELIKYKGATVSPAEIEAVFLQHPAVTEVGVVAVHHPDCGEVPAAFVVTQPGVPVTEDELVSFISDQLTTINMEGGIRFVTQLPRGAGSKLDRKALRDML